MRPYTEQIEIAEAAAYHHQGCVSAVTGFGKSLSIALIIQKLQVRTLVVVPNLNLKVQLSETLKKWFGSLENITVENIDSPSLKSHTSYDCLVIDEAHRSAAKTYRKLSKTAWKDIYYRFAFTGTPFRNREEEQLLLESVAGQVIYELDYRTALSKGYVAKVESYFFEVPKTKIKGNERSWASMYSELVTNNAPRNELISRLLLSLEANKKSVLCLVKEVKHGENLQALTSLPFMHGEADNNRIMLLEFLLQEKYGLLGTTGVVGEGTDTKSAEYVVIAGLGKSRPQIMQMIGRGVRVYLGKESCKIIIFLDKSHKWTRKHFRTQCKILFEEYGCIPSKLEI